MAASIRCPHCSEKFEVPPFVLGGDVKCLHCKKYFVAPKLSDVSAALPTTRPRPSEFPSRSSPSRTASKHAKSSNAILWILLAGCAILLLGGCGLATVGAAAFFFLAAPPKSVSYQTISPPPAISSFPNQTTDIDEPPAVPKKPDKPDFRPPPIDPPTAPPIAVSTFQSRERMPEFVAGTFTPNGTFLALGGDGKLRRHINQNLSFHGQIYLEKIGTQMVVDENRGLLYLAATADVAFSPAGRPTSKAKMLDMVGPSDLLVYDVKSLLARGETENAVLPRAGGSKMYARLKPMATIPIQAKVSHLTLAPDGNALFFLNLNDAKIPKLCRVDAATKSVAATLALPEHTTVMRLAADGKSAYVLVGIGRGAGELRVIEIAELNLVQSIPLKFAPADLAVASGGTAYVSGEQRGIVAVFDVKAPFSEIVTWDGFSPNSRLAISFDSDMLFAATDESPQFIEAWRLPAAVKNKPIKIARGAGLTDQIRLSPDGSRIVLPNGTVYRAIN